MKILFVLILLILGMSPHYWHFDILGVLRPVTARSTGTQGLAYSKYEEALYDSQTVVNSSADIEWSIRKSFDGGMNWQTLHTHKVSATAWSAGGRGIAFSPKGSVFAIGRTEDSDKRSHWLVLRGQDFGKNWSLVDDFTLFPGAGDHYAYHLAVSEKGKVCVAGKLSDNTDFSKITEQAWVVRCSEDDGDTWTTIDQQSAAQASAIAFNSLGDLFVAGTEFIQNDPNVMGKLQVKFLEAGSSQWKVIDSFQFDGKYSGAISGFVDSKDCFLIAGSGWVTTVDNSQLRRWFVRRTCNAGQDWETLDSYTLEPTMNAEAYQITEDTKGRLFVAGYAQDLTKIYHTVVRMSEDQGKTWGTITDSVGSNSLGIYGHNITAAKDRIFVSGGWYNDKSRWSILAEVVFR